MSLRGLDANFDASQNRAVVNELVKQFNALKMRVEDLIAEPDPETPEPTDLSEVNAALQQVREDINMILATLELLELPEVDLTEIIERIDALEVGQADLQSDIEALEMRTGSLEVTLSTYSTVLAQHAEMWEWYDATYNGPPTE